MNLQELTLLTLKVSIILIVFGIGLNAHPKDAAYLFSKPGLLLRSFFSMYVLMPLCALLLTFPFDFSPALKVALITLAVGPVPPVLPKKVFKAGGGTPYTIGLFVASALFAVLFIPLAIALFGMIFNVQARMSVVAVASLVLTSVLVPLGAGITVRSVVPGFADRIAQPISMLSTLLLIAGVAPVIFTAWPAIVSLIGNGTIAVLAVFICVGIVVGDLLGGPNIEDRTVLALSSASRHPGIALAIAGANFPSLKQVSAAVLLYLIINAVLTIPYIFWSRRQHARAA